MKTYKLNSNINLLNQLTRLSLFEVLTINEFINIQKVPGGWIHIINIDTNISTCFIPKR